MKYDFNNVTDRRGSGSYKWDTPTDGDILPLWVADMDFKTAPCIISALRARVDHGIFGYTKVSENYYDAVINWFGSRHDWHIDRDSIIYTSGVVPALSAIIKAMTTPGDNIALLTPAYNCFFSSIRNNSCNALEVPMIFHSDGYSIDFEKLEIALALPSTTLMIVCNPHNPGGRVWNRDELKCIGDMCLKHNVFVISDEIHCELTFYGHQYTPYATLGSEYALRSAICVSPSKAFNIAGLQIANIVAADKTARARIDRAININEVCDVNPFGVIATIAAYNEGSEWFEDLKEYIRGNFEWLQNYIYNHLPEYKLMPLEGTYLAWIDCSAARTESSELERMIEKECRVMLSPGKIYGSGGEYFMRINLACPRAILQEAMARLAPMLQRLSGR